MGDRGNIVVRQGETNRDDVWFYTHWAGSDLQEVVQKALAKNKRWNDSSYLARIIFDTLTEGQQGEETGFGIAASIGDNSHDIVVVDCPNQSVFVIAESALNDGRIPNGFKPVKVWSFKDFAAT